MQLCILYPTDNIEYVYRHLKSSHERAIIIHVSHSDGACGVFLYNITRSAYIGEYILHVWRRYCLCPVVLRFQLDRKRFVHQNLFLLESYSPFGHQYYYSQYFNRVRTKQQCTLFNRIYENWFHLPWFWKLICI